ncbi:PPA1309 family protein [Nocardia sp. CNY236]|uniref:PPA1309 family protein n=1 Tax=Nocardia sp. CNY236 TaxID=1169152 RepID=UPI00040EC384|nr:PPA1309 family protein [Nocardia sp. CNY236]
MTSDLHAELVLARSVREVAEFVDAEGWGRPPHMFALVPTADLMAAQPDLADQLDPGAELTPVAQDSFLGDTPGESKPLDEMLATISWPAAVQGCLLVQEIVVLPPDAESALDDALVPVLADADAADAAARAAAEAHPRRREARLFTAVLRSGASLSLLHLRPDNAESADSSGDLDLRTYPNLAPNLVEALHHTLA